MTSEINFGHVTCAGRVSRCGDLNTEALGQFVSASVMAKQCPLPLGVSTKSLRRHHIDPKPAAMTQS